MTALQTYSAEETQTFGRGRSNDFFDAIWHIATSVVRLRN